MSLKVERGSVVRVAAGDWGQYEELGVVLGVSGGKDENEVRHPYSAIETMYPTVSSAYQRVRPFTKSRVTKGTEDTPGYRELVVVEGVPAEVLETKEKEDTSTVQLFTLSKGVHRVPYQTVRTNYGVSPLILDGLAMLDEYGSRASKDIWGATLFPVTQSSFTSRQEMTTAYGFDSVVFVGYEKDSNHGLMYGALGLVKEHDEATGLYTVEFGRSARAKVSISDMIRW